MVDKLMVDKCTDDKCTVDKRMDAEKKNIKDEINHDDFTNEEEIEGMGSGASA